MVERVCTDKAPKPIGPYSQAVIVEGFCKVLFTSGQIPLDPATGSVVEGDIKVQARQAIENLLAVISSAGADVRNVVKVNVYLADINDFSGFNEVYSEYFKAVNPARTVVEVSALPKNVRVEIEAIAVIR